MTKETRIKLGLIGYPLSHSFSPGYFADKFCTLGLTDADYQAYPIERIEMVRELLDGDMTGLNVTIPYKEQVIPYLDELSDEAEQIGAVNTITIVGGHTTGYNTDVDGFENSLKPCFGDVLPERALILGTGGASKAVKYVLNRLGISYQMVSRTKGDLTYDEITPEVIAEHHLIVNTTPLGMYPKVDTCPHLPYDYLTPDHILYDLVYNPEKTLFLTRGQEKGSTVKNGHDMLILQAERAWEIWCNTIES